MTFLALELAKITISWGHILTKNLNFHGHLWAFRAEITPKSRPFKAESNAQKLPNIFQNNFEKVERTTFLTMEMAKITISGGQILTKNLNFRGHL